MNLSPTMKSNLLKTLLSCKKIPNELGDCLVSTSKQFKKTYLIGGKHYTLRRLIYSLSNPSEGIPDKVNLKTSCSTPNCINPEHVIFKAYTEEETEEEMLLADYDSLSLEELNENITAFFSSQS